MKIAIIDSGINANHSHVQSVAGGVGICTDQNGLIQYSSDYSDNLGHGTAIAGVIREKSPKANLFAIKIFYEKLSASTRSLLAALKWSLDQEMKIIHLSLGTTLDKYKTELRQLCNQAYQMGTVIVSAGRSPDDHIYPACFETVVGVYWHPECQADKLKYHSESILEFGAHGQPRALPGLSQNQNFHGHSFAAAHVTAHTAQLLELYPHLDLLEIKTKLAQNL